MKTLNLTFTDKDYKKLKQTYEDLKKDKPYVRSWEKFMLEVSESYI